MIKNKPKCNRIIGLDMHPDVFAAAALQNTDAASAKTLWVHDRQKTAQLEQWADKHLQPGDVLLLEASGNSFEVASRLHTLGFTALVLESAQAGKLRENFCNDDRHSAVKLARVHLSGLAKLVWQPDEATRDHREVFFAHRNAVKDTTRCRNRIRGFLNEHCVRLPTGTRLTQASGLKRALSLYNWNALQQSLLEDKFSQLWETEKRRKRLEQTMIAELIARPAWARLWRMMGIRHRVAFGLMAMIGDVHRFATAKKLVGYLGLAPRKEQSGNNRRGRQPRDRQDGTRRLTCLTYTERPKCPKPTRQSASQMGLETPDQKESQIGGSSCRTQTDCSSLAFAHGTLHTTGRT